MSGALRGAADPPAFLAPLARRAAPGDEVLGRPLRNVPERWEGRRSAVLILLAGTELAGAHLLLEERSHTMRSQPAQYALPGGRVEPEDAGDEMAALREAREETGLDPRRVHLLGAFAPIAMPWRDYSVRPVVGWVPSPPPLAAVDPAEVASVLWAPLIGPGSLTDAAVRGTGWVDGREVGPAFDLPGDAFVWGFTAMIVEAALEALGLTPTPGGSRRMDVPELRRRAGP